MRELILHLRGLVELLIVIGILACGVNIIRFAVEPLTTNILLMWFAADLICFAIMGALVGAIYKPLSAAQ